MNLQTELTAFYASMEARLAVCEAAPKMDLCEEIVWDADGMDVVSDYNKCASLFIATSRNERPGEIRALVAAVRALDGLCGPSNDPFSGWRGDASHPDMFACEACKREHENLLLIEHAEDCPIVFARATLAAIKSI